MLTGRSSGPGSHYEDRIEDMKDEVWDALEKIDALTWDFHKALSADRFLAQ